MRAARRRALFSVVMLLMMPGRIDSQFAINDLHLGFAECAPAVFLPLQPGTAVKIEVTYADTGMLSSFRENITRDDRAATTLLIAVDVTKWTGRCSSLGYTVAINGKTIASPMFDGFDEAKLPRTVAFSPVANIGAVIGGGPLEGDFRTQMAYDDRHRRYISQQTFGSGGRLFEIAFSDYGWTPRGSIAGYSARIREVTR